MVDTIELSQRDLLQQERRDHVADEPCTAETAECCCPDFCERDHANE